MTATIARTLDEACAALADRPHAVVLAGGTDLMVEANRGGRDMEDVVVVDRIPELRGWAQHGGSLRIGACTTCAEIGDGELASLVPALAQAARTVGSPQIRNAATIGGNLGTASPAGDTLPVLAALDAEVEVRSASASRMLPLHDFVIGPKATALEPGELIAAVHLPVTDGPQEFLKVGVRNAMVISVASLALVVDRPGRNVRIALGSVGPVPIRAVEAEVLAAERIDWSGNGILDSEVVERVCELVADAARPIDDHRGTIAYRRHAVAVLARRSLRRALASGEERNGL